MFIGVLIILSVKAQYSQDISVETLLKTDTTTIGQGFLYPDVQKDEITISKIILQPGTSTGWHKHEFPVFAYILEGNLTVDLGNGKYLDFSENTTFAEVINTLHNGMNKGDKKVVLIAFYLSEKGKSLSVRP